MEHVLITGGNGFIGSHLVARLAQEKQTNVTVFDLFPYAYGSLPEGVRFIQGDLKDAQLVQRTLQDFSIDVVYHVAWASIHESSIQNPAADIQDNLEPTVRLLEACRLTGVKKVVFISSGGTVYGIPQAQPVREDHPTNPISAYGVTKLAVEKYLSMYYHLYGLPCIILRPSVPYGPRQNPHRRQGVVSIFIYRALRRLPVTIWGDGENARDYFYIGDLAGALLVCKNQASTGPAIFNVGGAEMISLNTLVEKIQKTLGLTMQVRYEPARKFDVPAIKLDCSAAAAHLNWTATTSLENGILYTAEWLEKWMD